jgi:hypothetical protein
MQNCSAFLLEFMKASLGPAVALLAAAVAWGQWQTAKQRMLLLREVEKNKGMRLGAGPGRGKTAVAARDRRLDDAQKLAGFRRTRLQRRTST